jgi:mRNA interferase RelE/StbE
MYNIVYSDLALKNLLRIPGKEAFKIRRKVEFVAANPYARNPNVTKLQGRDGYRLRVGNWRVIYDISNTLRILGVENIGSRGNIYQ